MEHLDLKGTRRIGGIPYARVSHISGYRVSDKRAQSNKALMRWREKFKKDHPELPDDFHSQRGTFLHAAIEHFLLTGQPQDYIHSWAAPFWPYAKPIASRLKNHLWIEKPIQNDLITWPTNLSFETPDGNIRHHIWHDDGFVGTPDYIGTYRTKVTIVDWKTSTTPYEKKFPGYSKTSHITDPRQKEIIKAKDKKRINGFYKFQRTCAQLGAYTQAIEQRIGKSNIIRQGLIGVFIQPNLNEPENITKQELVIPRSVLNEAYDRFRINLELWKQEHKKFIEESKRKALAIKG